MSLTDAMARTRAFFADNLGQEATIVTATPQEEGWRVIAEVIVEAEYMRRRAQRELIAAYEVLLDGSLNVTGFERREIRARGTPSSLE